MPRQLTVVTCAKLWYDEIIEIKIKANDFLRLDAWTHKSKGHFPRWHATNCVYLSPLHTILPSCTTFLRHMACGTNYVHTTHYTDVIMDARASQITCLTIVYSTVYSGADQRKHQSYASLAFVWGIHRWPMNSPHKGPVTRKILPFDDVIVVNR